MWCLPDEELRGRRRFPRGILSEDMIDRMPLKRLRKGVGLETQVSTEHAWVEMSSNHLAIRGIQWGRGRERYGIINH